MRHCNSVFNADDIWFLVDDGDFIKRKMYIKTCPICNKEMVLYSHYDSKTNEYYEKYYYSGGAKKIKERNKKYVSSTMLGFATKYKMPFGFKYGINKEIKKNGEIVGIKQFASDFYGNKSLVKVIEKDELHKTQRLQEEK